MTRGPPAHRVAARVLSPAAIVVADLELDDFTALSRVDARRHVVVRDAHHDTHAPRMTIGELICIHRPTVVGIDPVVDRHVPGELQGVTVDFDLALGHDAVPLIILPEKDVEPERKLPERRWRVIRWGLAPGRLVLRVVVAWRVDTPTARPLPGDALCRGWRDPVAGALRRHAYVRLVGTRRGQQSGRNEARPDDQGSAFSHHMRP